MTAERKFIFFAVIFVALGGIIGCSEDESNPVTPAQVVTLDSYENANVVHPTSTNSGNWNAQSFSLQKGAYIDSIGVNVLEIARNPGNLVISLYSNSAGGPANLISQFLPVEAGIGWLVGSADSGVAIVGGEVYWLVVSSTADGGSLELEHDNQGTYESGDNSYSYDAGGSWVPRPGTDLLFKVVGRWKN